MSAFYDLVEHFWGIVMNPRNWGKKTRDETCKRRVALNAFFVVFFVSSVMETKVENCEKGILMFSSLGRKKINP